MEFSGRMDFSLMPNTARYRTPGGLAARAPLQVVGLGEQTVSTLVTQRRLDGFGLVFVSAGAGTLWTAASGLLAVAAPALFWLFPGIFHTYGAHEGTGWTESWVLLEGSLPRDALAAGWLTPAAPLVPPEPALAHHFAAVAAAFDAPAPAAATALLRLIDASGASPDAADSLAAGAAAHIRRHATESIDFTALAASFGVSPATLRRRFLAAYGQSPKALQLALRLDRAKQLLATTDTAVAAIARALGFADAYYFSRLFSAREGLAPTEFRRRHRRR
jgi:AraC-like DNA-binding protein